MKKPKSVEYRPSGGTKIKDRKYSYLAAKARIESSFAPAALPGVSLVVPTAEVSDFPLKKSALRDFVSNKNKFPIKTN